MQYIISTIHNSASFRQKSSSSRARMVLQYTLIVALYDHNRDGRETNTYIVYDNSKLPGGLGKPPEIRHCTYFRTLI